MAKGDDQPGLTTKEVVRLCGVPSSTLDSWVSKGLCRPSLVPPSGKRAERYWSVRDVVAVRALRALRKAGCSLAILHRAMLLIEREWRSHLGDTVLVWDGRDLITLTPAGDVVSLVTRAGQSMLQGTVLQSVACPIGTWERQLADSLVDRPPMPFADIRARHARRAAQRAVDANWVNTALG